MTSQTTDLRDPKRHDLQRTLRKFFARPAVEIGVAVMVLVSVALTLIELANSTGGPPPQTWSYASLVIVNHIITMVFAIELSLRFFASSSKRAFFREYWIDILAVLPLFRVFRAARILRLLRLFRVMRLLGIATRLASHYPEVFRRGMVEYVVVCCLLLTTVVFGTVAIMFFENGSGQAAVGSELAFDFEHAFWFSVYSLSAGEPIPESPRTLEGKVVAVFIMFMGLTIFAMFTGTVSAFMIERFRTEGANVNWEDLDDHIVICGWNSKTEIIIREYQASESLQGLPIVVISEVPFDEAGIPADLQKNMVYLHEDFTRIPVLEKAGIQRARTCIILSDVAQGRSEQDADARTILAALTVEKINPEVYTCAEILNRQYGSHLAMGRVNDYVVSGDYSAYLLAQSAMNRGLMGVVGELLTYQHGQEFYRQPIAASWQGKTFDELLVELKQKHQAILVAVHTVDHQQLVNPRDYTFRAGDEIVIISTGEIPIGAA